jgi:16S rRNA (cytidine1402-2'-O)-methyltransferase
MAGVLYIVPTPIGNLEDITLRALRVLKEVDLIAAEDTRHTRHLLNHYGIRTALASYHQHNEREKSLSLVDRMKNGADIALVCDAGTPAISDPGYRLVVEAIRAQIQVIPLPGASALATVLSASGLPTDRCAFEGFLPSKRQERRAKLRTLREGSATLIFYEAPHRLKETLHDMLEIFGDREMVIARELTKVHEEFLRGMVSDLVQRLTAREIRGEIVILVKGASVEDSVSESALKTEILRLKDEGMRVKEIAEILGERYGYSKKAIYRLTLELDKMAML